MCLNIQFRHLTGYRGRYVNNMAAVHLGRRRASVPMYFNISLFDGEVQPVG